MIYLNLRQKLLLFRVEHINFHSKWSGLKQIVILTQNSCHFLNADVDDLNYLVDIELRKCIVELIFPRPFCLFFHFLNLLSKNKVGLKPWIFGIAPLYPPYFLLSACWVAVCVKENIYITKICSKIESGLAFYLYYEKLFVVD